MWWRTAFELLRLSNTPATIFSPFPLFAISLFLVSHKELSINNLPVMIAGILVSWLLTFPSNLWNHCNDLKEDAAAGKKTILTQEASIQKTAIYISILLYLCSLLFAYYLSNEFQRPIFLSTLIWVLSTWWYSDNLILKKVIGFRLKENYKGELAAYSIAMPMHSLSVGLVYSNLDLRLIIITAAIFFFSMSGLMLKDLKDISGDRIAGLRTFGVVFPPSQLMKYSCYLMVGFYLIMLHPFAVNSFGAGILVLIFPFIYFFKNTFIHFYRKNWNLDIEDLKAIKGIGNSIYASFILIGVSAFI